MTRRSVGRVRLRECVEQDVDVGVGAELAEAEHHDLVGLETEVRAHPPARAAHRIGAHIGPVGNHDHRGGSRSQFAPGRLRG